MAEVLAAIDVGTNSLHLVVARVDDDDQFEVVTREREMVRLGTGSGDMKLLTADAIDAVVSLVPDTWIGEAEAAAARAAYRQYLLERLMPPRTFLDEALRVR